MSMFETLSKSPLFKGILPVEIEKLLAQVRTQVKRYKKGNTVAFRGDKCSELLILVEGSIRGEMLDYSGKVVEVETVTAPKPIAAAFVFGVKSRFPVDAVAENDLTVLSIPRDSLVRLLQMNPVVLTNYLNLISNKTHFLTERLWFMSFKTIKEKLAHYILSIAKPGETSVTLPKNQQELSEFFGVSRPALARVIGELGKENILQCSRREVIITDYDRLAQFLESK